MADAYRREGMAARPATFSLFVRALPAGRGYLVAAGLDDCLDWLSRLRFTGSVRAVPEGTIVFGDEPILEVDAPIAEAQLAKTFLLNQVTLQTTLATKAARFRHAAAGRAVVDFALRRTQGIDAGMKLTRVCRLVGLDSTSNVAGADRYGVPASGTMAHFFVQAHHDEADAFRAFTRTLADDTILLVDTYDTSQGVDRAITVVRERHETGGRIRGIRLDSGDLAALARDARRRLDGADLGDVAIFASGGLTACGLARSARRHRRGR